MQKSFYSRSGQGCRWWTETEPKLDAVVSVDPASRATDMRQQPSCVQALWMYRDAHVRSRCGQMPHQNTQSAAGSNLTSAAPVASTAGGASAAASAGFPAPHIMRAFAASDCCTHYGIEPGPKRTLEAYFILKDRACRTILVPQLQLHRNLLAGCAPPLCSRALQHSLHGTDRPSINQLQMLKCISSARRAVNLGTTG